VSKSDWDRGLNVDGVEGLEMVSWAGYVSDGQDSLGMLRLNVEKARDRI
jgi:hypothetical protein